MGHWPRIHADYANLKTTALLVSLSNMIRASPRNPRLFSLASQHLACAPTTRQVRFNHGKIMEFTVAITGASGSIYAQRTLVHLAASGVVERINLIMSAAATTVARVELGVDLSGAERSRVNQWLGLPAQSRLIHLHRLDNIAARPSSGSHPQEGMVIVPCSMGTLGAIASGAGTNLIHRAADVTLKESRRLVLVPRETPYSAIHLENMLRLSRAGAHIIPASPGFYHRPQTIEALVDHLVFRILDHLGVPHSQATQWQGLKERPDETIDEPGDTAERIDLAEAKKD